MWNIVEKLKVQGVRDSTKRIYYSVWKNFNQFFIKLDIKPPTWEERLTLYVAHLVNTGHRSQTCKSYISAIKKVLAEDSVELSINKCLLASLTRAWKLKNDRVIARLPIQKGLLELIISKTKQYFDAINQDYLATLYCTMFSTAYYGLFRVGEITAGEHPVMVKDVMVDPIKQKILFILRSSKMHGRDAQPQMIKITSQPNTADMTNGGNSNRKKYTYPYFWLNKYMYLRPCYLDHCEPFFIFRDFSPVKPRHMRNVL